MKVKSESEVAQSCPTPRDPMDYTVHGILQARILKWEAFPFSRGSSQPRMRGPRGRGIDEQEEGGVVRVLCL